MIDAGVSPRDVQIAARHADAKTTMRYDRARRTSTRHPNYILAAFRKTTLTLARFCRVRSYLVAARNHGINTIDAIHAALAGSP